MRATSARPSAVKRPSATAASATPQTPPPLSGQGGTGTFEERSVRTRWLESAADAAETGGNSFFLGSATTAGPSATATDALPGPKATSVNVAGAGNTYNNNNSSATSFAAVSSPRSKVVVKMRDPLRSHAAELLEARQATAVMDRIHAACQDLILASELAVFGIEISGGEQHQQKERKKKSDDNTHRDDWEQGTKKKETPFLLTHTPIFTPPPQSLFGVAADGKRSSISGFWGDEGGASATSGGGGGNGGGGGEQQEQGPNMTLLYGGYGVGGGNAASPQNLLRHSPAPPPPRGNVAADTTTAAAHPPHLSSYSYSRGRSSASVATLRGVARDEDGQTARDTLAGVLSHLRAAVAGVEGAAVAKRKIRGREGGGEQQQLARIEDREEREGEGRRTTTNGRRMPVATTMGDALAPPLSISDRPHQPDQEQEDDGEGAFVVEQHQHSTVRLGGGNEPKAEDGRGNEDGDEEKEVRKKATEDGYSAGGHGGWRELANTFAMLRDLVELTRTDDAPFLVTTAQQSQQQQQRTAMTAPTSAMDGNGSSPSSSSFFASLRQLQQAGGNTSTSFSPQRPSASALGGGAANHHGSPLRSPAATAAAVNAPTHVEMLVPAEPAGAAARRSNKQQQRRGDHQSSRQAYTLSPTDVFGGSGGGYGNDQQTLLPTHNGLRMIRRNVRIGEEFVPRPWVSETLRSARALAAAALLSAQRLADGHAALLRERAEERAFSARLYCQLLQQQQQQQQHQPNHNSASTKTGGGSNSSGHKQSASLSSSSIPPPPKHLRGIYPFSLYYGGGGADSAKTAATTAGANDGGSGSSNKALLLLQQPRDSRGGKKADASAPLPLIASPLLAAGATFALPTNNGVSNGIGGGAGGGGGDFFLWCVSLAPHRRLRAHLLGPEYEATRLTLSGLVRAVVGRSLTGRIVSGHEEEGVAFMVRFATAWEALAFDACLHRYAMYLPWPRACLALSYAGEQLNPSPPPPPPPQSATRATTATTATDGGEGKKKSKSSLSKSVDDADTTALLLLGGGGKDREPSESALDWVDDAARKIDFLEVAMANRNGTPQPQAQRPRRHDSDTDGEEAAEKEERQQQKKRKGGGANNSNNLIALAQQVPDSFVGTATRQRFSREEVKEIRSVRARVSATEALFMGQVEALSAAAEARAAEIRERREDRLRRARRRREAEKEIAAKAMAAGGGNSPDLVADSNNITASDPEDANDDDYLNDDDCGAAEGEGKQQQHHVELCYIPQPPPPTITHGGGRHGSRPADEGTDTGSVSKGAAEEERRARFSVFARRGPLLRSAVHIQSSASSAAAFSPIATPQLVAAALNTLSDGFATLSSASLLTNRPAAMALEALRGQTVEGTVDAMIAREHHLREMRRRAELTTRNSSGYGGSEDSERGREGAVSVVGQPPKPSTSAASVSIATASGGKASVSGPSSFVAGAEAAAPPLSFEPAALMAAHDLRTAGQTRLCAVTWHALRHRRRFTAAEAKTTKTMRSEDGYGGSSSRMNKPSPKHGSHSICLVDDCPMQPVDRWWWCTAAAPSLAAALRGVPAANEASRGTQTEAFGDDGFNLMSMGNGGSGQSPLSLLSHNPSSPALASHGGGGGANSFAASNVAALSPHSQPNIAAAVTSGRGARGGRKEKPQSLIPLLSVSAMVDRKSLVVSADIGGGPSTPRKERREAATTTTAERKRAGGGTAGGKRSSQAAEGATQRQGGKHQNAGTVSTPRSLQQRSGVPAAFAVSPTPFRIHAGPPTNASLAITAAANAALEEITQSIAASQQRDDQIAALEKATAALNAASARGGAAAAARRAALLSSQIQQQQEGVVDPPAALPSAEAGANGADAAGTATATATAEGGDGATTATNAEEANLNSSKATTKQRRRLLQQQLQCEREDGPMEPAPTPTPTHAETASQTNCGAADCAPLLIELEYQRQNDTSKQMSERLADKQIPLAAEAVVACGAPSAYNFNNFAAKSLACAALLREWVAGTGGVSEADVIRFFTELLAGVDAEGEGEEAAGYNGGVSETAPFFRDDVRHGDAAFVRSYTSPAAPLTTTTSTVAAFAELPSIFPPPKSAPTTITTDEEGRGDRCSPHSHSERMNAVMPAAHRGPYESPTAGMLPPGYSTATADAASGGGGSLQPPPYHPPRLPAALAPRSNNNNGNGGEHGKRLGEEALEHSTEDAEAIASGWRGIQQQYKHLMAVLGRGGGDIRNRCNNGGNGNDAEGAAVSDNNSGTCTSLRLRLPLHANDGLLAAAALAAVGHTVAELRSAQAAHCDEHLRTTHELQTELYNVAAAALRGPNAVFVRSKIGMGGGGSAVTSTLTAAVAPSSASAALAAGGKGGQSAAIAAAAAVIVPTLAAAASADAAASPSSSNALVAGGGGGPLVPAALHAAAHVPAWYSAMLTNKKATRLAYSHV